MSQMRLDGKTEIVCTCINPHTKQPLKKPWDLKYHYENCPWLKEQEKKVVFVGWKKDAIKFLEELAKEKKLKSSSKDNEGLP